MRAVKRFHHQVNVKIKHETREQITVLRDYGVDTGELLRKGVEEIVEQALKTLEASDFKPDGRNF